MFKRGVLVLLLASIVAMSAEVEGVSKSIDITTNLKHPVVKSVTQVNGKIQVVLKEGTVDQNTPEQAEAADEDEDEDDTTQDSKTPTQDAGEEEEEEEYEEDNDPTQDEDEEDVPDQDEADEGEEGEDQDATQDEDEDEIDDRKVSVGNETISDGKGGIIGKKAHKKAHKKAVKAHKKDEDDGDEEDDDDKKHHKKAVKAHKKWLTKEDEDDEDGDDEVDDEKHHKKAVKAHKAVAKKSVKKSVKKANKKANKKDASVEKTKDGEIRHYKFGTVEIVAQPQTSGKRAKKAHKKDAPQDKPAAEDANVQEKEVNLEKGETLILEYRGHLLNFTATDKDTLLFTADDKETIELPKAEVYDIDVPGTIDEGNKTDNSTEVTTAPLVLKEVKSDLKKAKKSINSFTELATRVTGNTVPKEAAPIVFVCGLVGALAAIVGVAAVALGRAHHDAAAEDPASVLADAEVEDVEAGIQKKSDDDKTEDAAAEKSDSLSDSESDSEVEEGTFANDKSASV